MYEDVECLNCEWEGKSTECTELDVCPNCECDGYLQTAEHEFEGE